MRVMRQDTSLLQDFGWQIYYKLKALPYNMVLQRKRLMLQYLKLSLDRPSLLHSRIMVQAIAMKKRAPSGFRFRDFVAIWGLENLRPEDWERSRNGKKRTSTSLVENLIGTYVKEISEKKLPASDDFINLIDKAIDTYSSNPNLHLYKAQALVSAGRNDEALAYYKTMLKRWPRKYFLWSRAEELLPSDDLDLRIAFLSKSIACVKDQSLLGDIRLNLAGLLIKNEQKAYALFELLQYERYYISQNWRIKESHEILKNRILSLTPDIQPLPTPYADFTPLADRFLSLP